MFQTAPTLSKHVQEHVTLERQEPPITSRLAHDLFQVFRAALAIPFFEIARVHELMFTAFNFEFAHGQGARDDRRINERVVIGGAKVIGPAVRRGVQPTHRAFPLRS